MVRKQLQEVATDAGVSISLLHADGQPEDRRALLLHALEQARVCSEEFRVDTGHQQADAALLAYINDDAVTAAYERVLRYYD